MKEARVSRQSDIAQQSLDPIAGQVVRDQVVTEQVSTKFRVFVTLRIFVSMAFLYFALSTIGHPLYHILTIAFNSNTLQFLFQ